MKISTLIRRLHRTLAPDHVIKGGMLLPAKHLRFGGKEFKNDDYFLASCRAEARRVTTHCDFTAGKQVLDIGCGVGRLAIGLLAEFGAISGYKAVDVDANSIAWCQRHIQHKYPGFRFVRIDVHNRRYNPTGTHVEESFQLPFDTESFDVIYLYSVFSHMMTEDVNTYLREIRRLLRPKAIAFVTAFVEEGVEDVCENPAGYRMHWSGPLHCVRYEKGFFEYLLQNQGFRLTRFDYGKETDGQSAIYFTGDHTPDSVI